MILTEDVLQRYRANQGYVYLVHAVGTDRYKIGRSVNPFARLEILKKQSPYPLQIIECFWTPDAIADELAIHRKWSHLRMYGEWFQVESMHPKDLDPTFPLKNSNEEMFFEIFNRNRPTHEHLSELINRDFVQKTRQRKDLGKIADILFWDFFDLEREICDALCRCSSVTHLQETINFIDASWVDAVKSSLVHLGDITCRESIIAFCSVLHGFAWSLLTLCED